MATHNSIKVGNWDPKRISLGVFFCSADSRWAGILWPKLWPARAFCFEYNINEHQHRRNQPKSNYFQPQILIKMTTQKYHKSQLLLEQPKNIRHLMHVQRLESGSIYSYSFCKYIGHKEHQRTTDQNHGWSKSLETPRRYNLLLNSFTSSKASLKLENIRKPWSQSCAATRFTYTSKAFQNQLLTSVLELFRPTILPWTFLST